MIKFVTCIYSNLYGTELGGRHGRSEHYRWSLLSLLKMKNSQFICYTSEHEYQSLQKFFYVDHNINQNQLLLRIYDISNSYYKDTINKYKNYESVRSSDRCHEIQYMKFKWLYDESIDSDDNSIIYWIDAGLSHCGLIPDKYMNPNLPAMRKYYESNMFSDSLLSNIVKFTDDKIFIIAKENVKHYWDGTVDRKYYDKYCADHHVIGGMFGGSKNNNLWLTQLFTDYVELISSESNRLYAEENILSLIYHNNIERFSVKKFDIWWHENEKVSGITSMIEYLEGKKSFYKVIEELL